MDKFLKMYKGNAAKEINVDDLVSLMSGKQTIPHKERFLVHYKSGYVPILKDAISCFHKDQN
jgi:hypothetical protein